MRSASSFLAYERQGLTQPLAFAQLLGRYHRGSFLAQWKDIARMGGRVT
ncbi:hypothetical protein [Paenarthrobacter sp. A20]|nr:hypothetical protein [Paenarthrobacter sp. A20]MCP1413925.1 hypothetical protein [Paenarthrobacter sp. A20]